MQRYKITIEYDGTGLLGWQRQNIGDSVQSLLEEVIYKFCQEEVTVQGSGRTDAGVHARGQVVHFDLNSPKDPRNIMMGINHHLGYRQISVLNIAEVSPEFHARFDARRRVYRYHIVNRNSYLALDGNRAWHIYQPIDIALMQEGAKCLIGKHDFTSFRASGCQAKSPIKTIYSIEITRNGENIYIEVEALSFLHRMIRNIVGTLVEVGTGREDIAFVERALEALNRDAAGPAAPACGLYFMLVEY